MHCSSAALALVVATSQRIFALEVGAEAGDLAAGWTLDVGVFPPEAVQQGFESLIIEVLLFFLHRHNN
jgi:hypothetical protein